MRITVKFIACIVILVGAAIAQSTLPDSADPVRQQSKASADRVANNSPSNIQFAERYPRYLLRPADVIELTFEFTPEFNQVVPVQPDGFVTLRGIGDLHASGKNVGEFKLQVVKAYSAILNNPSVSVMLKEFEKPFFTAAGHVSRPGRYDIRGDITVTEAVAVAGGFDQIARDSKVVLYRRISGEWLEAKVIDVKKLMKERNIREDTRVQAGDVIFVPESRFATIRRYIPAPGMGVTVNPTQF
jgi:polysaccharide biosynthesis/export protein